MRQFVQQLTIVLNVLRELEVSINRLHGITHLQHLVLLRHDHHLEGLQRCLEQDQDLMLSLINLAHILHNAER